jgi:hypothetical protein
LAAELSDLEVVERQLRRFQAKGALKPETVANMLERIKAYREGLLHSTVKQVPISKPQPVVQPKPAVAPPIGRPVAPAATQPEPLVMAVEIVEEKPKEVVAKPALPAFSAMPQAAKVIEKPKPVPPRPPRKSFGEVLGSFLQDRNIHWTELTGVLLGGLLIVGFSTGFVVAYWKILEPFWKFSIFVGYSSIIFAAGLFTFHRWKLQMTGRGLMTIGTLLAPLDFLAMAHSKLTAVSAIAELIALGLFACLIAFAAKSLTRGGRIPLTGAVIGNSIVILLAGQLFGETVEPWKAEPWMWMIFGFLSAGIFTAASMWHLRQVGGEIGKDKVGEGFLHSDTADINVYVAQPSPPTPLPKGEGRKESSVLEAVNSLFMMLGVSGFAAALGLALIGTKAMSLSMPVVLQLLASPFCLLAVPLLCVGLELHRRMPRNAKLEAQRTVATAIGLLGVGMQIAALGFAWPQPLLVAAVGVLSAGCLVYLALKHDFPLAHAGAMIGAAIAYLAVFFLFRDSQLRDWQNQGFLIQNAKLGATMLNLSFSAASGTALGGLFSAFAAVSEYFARRGKKEHGAIYVAGSCVVAAVGMLLVTWHGLDAKPDELTSNVVRATSLYALYGIVGVLLSLRWSKKRLSYIGWNLLAASPFWLLRLTPSGWQWDFALFGCLLWTAAIWFWLAWQHRNQLMFTLQQIVLMLSGLAGVYAWLAYRGWIGEARFDWLKAYNLQAFGAVLAAISLGWLIVRIAGRTSERLQLLLSPPWLPVDKMATCGLVVFQTVMFVPMALEGIGHELTLSGKVPFFQDFCGPTAWLFFIFLAAIHVVALWDRWEKSHLAGSMLIATALPMLVSSYYAQQAANASAMRWGFAIIFLVVSAVIWFREQIYRYFVAWGAKFDLDIAISPLPMGEGQGVRAEAASTSASRSPHPNPLPKGEGIATALLARILCGVLTAGPVLAITVFMAMAQLAGTIPRGPSSGVFVQLGPSISYLVPLVLVIVGMVGYALRESSAIDAFLAGLVVELAVILGYPLHLATSVPKVNFGTEQFMIWVQLMTIAAAVWAIGWMVVRRWRNIWADDASSSKKKSLSTILMNVQIGFGVLGNALLIGLALLEVIFDHTQSFSFAAQEGMPLGWIALGLTIAAPVYRMMQRGGKFSPHAVGLAGMSVLALLACTVPNLPLTEAMKTDGIWPYRVLMIGWATYSLLVALTTWWVASQRTLPGAEGPPQAIVRMAAVWVRVAGIAAVLLGLKAGFLHQDLDGERLWAAAGIAIAATAGATMGVWRRREGWAFCAGLGANLAASLVVWHFEEAANLSFEKWWLMLVQANAIASSVVALVWLAAHRRLYQLRDASVRQSPLLAVQIAMPIVANAAILLLPVVSLFLDPHGLPDWMHKCADTAGWLSLLMPAVAAAWFLERVASGKLIHVLGGLGVGAGVLVACKGISIALYVEGDGTTYHIFNSWIEYHLLYASWTALALILFAITYILNRWRLTALTRLNLPRYFSPSLAEPWISAICLLTAILIARLCYLDTNGVWWSLIAIMILSFIVGMIAIWLRSAKHVYFSGLLLNLAGVVAWIAWGNRWGEKNAATFMEFQTLTLAAAGAIWTLLDIFGREWVPHFKVRIGGKLEGKSAPFAHLAVAAALVLLAVPTFYGIFCDLVRMEHDSLDRVGLFALAAVAVTLALMLWDRRAGYPWLGLYLTGILGIAVNLERHHYMPEMIYWRGGNELAAYALGTALVGWVFSKIRPTGRYLAIPAAGEHWNGQWFAPMQAFVVVIGSFVCVWLSVDFWFHDAGKEIAILGIGGQSTGAVGLLMALGAAILMAARVGDGLVKGGTAGLSSSAMSASDSELLGKPAVAPAEANSSPHSSQLLLVSQSERGVWQYAAFVLGMSFMASVRWASLDPEILTPWLHRGVSLLVASAMMCLLVTFGLPQLAKRFWAKLFAGAIEGRQTWSEAGRRMLPYFAGLTLGMLAVVLAQEGYSFNSESGTPLAVSETISVAVVMAAMLVLVLLFALREDFDPLKLSESGRQAYVYAAEALLALIGLHIWMTNPWLFQQGLVRKYWMFLVMAVAFAGAGLSEIFHRRKLFVLSRPLERTAMLLPLLPAVGFFIVDKQLGWNLISRTPLLWFFVAGFYGMMAYMRRSMVCGALAFITANMGLWVALTLHDLSFFKHPQLWLIPPALAALVAEFLNRDRLSKTQSAAFRYLALSVIYLSSTADMFILGIEGHWELPLALMLLSVAGALAGTFLRIRSFLLLGISFLVLDIIAVIWHAYSGGMTWILYVSGIALGAGIIAVFAIFEKRRNDILAAVEKLKQWD